MPNYRSAGEMEIRLMCGYHCRVPSHRWDTGAVRKRLTCGRSGATAMPLQERRAMWLQLPFPALEWLLGRQDLKVSRGPWPAVIGRLFYLLLSGPRWFRRMNNS